MRRLEASDFNSLMSTKMSMSGGCDRGWSLFRED